MLTQFLGGAKAFWSGWRGGSWQSNRTNPAYRGGRVTKNNNHFTPSNYSGDSAILESWELSTARARDLARNDPVLKKSLQMTSALTIGAGVLSFAEAQDANRDYLEEFCEYSDDEFEYWALNEADVTGRETFYEMQETSFREMVTTGAAIWLEVINNDPRRTSPLSYQLLELEQIDRTKDRPAERGQTRIVNGIELDRNNRAIAVWLYDEHPFEYGSYGRLHASKRIPIRRLIVNFRPDRISSHIGMTWLNCLVETANDTDALVSNELTKRRVAALMTLVVKRQNPGGSGSFTAALNADLDQQGNTAVKMGYPFIAEIGPNDDVEVAESQKNGEDYKAVIDSLLGHFAMGSGLSKHRLTGNAAEANLASIRAGHIDDERITDPIQKHQINKVVRPIRLRHQGMHAALGKFTGVGITPDFYFKNMRRMQEMFMIAAGDPDFQPKEDGEAAIDRMRSGRTSPQIEIARTGNYWRKIVRQTKQYFDYLEKNGLGSPDWTKGAGGTYLPFVPLDQQPIMQNAKAKGGQAAEASA